MLRLTLFLCLTLLLQISYGQQQLLKGRVFENKTHVPLAGIKVENLRSKQTTETDIEGKFSINVAVNDILALKGFAYLPDTIFLANLKITEFFMEPQKTQLKEVNIQDQKKINLGTITDPRFHGQRVVYQTDANGAYKGGIAIRLWGGKKDERKRKKREQQQKDEEISLQIDQVFSQANLQKYLPLKPEELMAFKIRYIPSVKVYMANDFNLLTYFDSCYKLFIKLPPEKRIPDKLTKP